MNVSSDAELVRLKARTKRSLGYVSARSIVIYAFQSISVLVLSYWLVPADYGIYAILNSLIGLSWFFCDVGIGGALIRQAENPTRDQLAVCAAVQIGLASVIALGFFIAAPWIAAAYNLDSSGILMVRVLALTIPFYAARGVPKLTWERGMEFEKIVRSEVGETFTMYLVQIVAAASGAGVWCFVLGNVARALSGTMIMKLSGGTFVMPRMKTSLLRPLLAFGLPFQASALVPALKSSIVPLVLGNMLATDRVGLITWAVGLASIPVILANNFNQVVFPSLSRLSDKPESQSHLANRSMQLACLGFGLIFGSAGAMSDSLVDWLFPAKWQEAKPLLEVAILATALSTCRVIAAATFNASNRPGLRLKLEIVGLIVEYVLAIVGLMFLREVGYLYALVAAHLVLLIATGWSLRDIFEISTHRRLLAVVIAGVLAQVLVKQVLHVPYLPLQLLAFICGFLLVGLIVDPKIKDDVRWFVRQLIAKRAPLKEKTP